MKKDWIALWWWFNHQQIFANRLNIKKMIIIRIFGVLHISCLKNYQYTPKKRHYDDALAYITQHYLLFYYESWSVRLRINHCFAINIYMEVWMNYKMFELLMFFYYSFINIFCWLININFNNEWYNSIVLNIICEMSVVHWS